MAVVFPIDSDFIPLTKDDVPISATIGNVNPGSTDIVGTIDDPAIYFTTDATHAFFRFRLRESPLSGSGFDQFAWVALFDINNNLAVDSYQWVVALDGNDEKVKLIQNTIPNAPQPGWGDVAEGVPIEFSITSYDIARAVPAGSLLGGDVNYFLDFSIELDVLRTNLGITDDTPLRFSAATSANANNFNKDILCDDFNNCFSDPFLLSTTLSGNVINKDTGEPVCDAIIELYQNNILIKITKTDFNGDFIFLEPEPGDYHLRISKCCYLSVCDCTTVTVQKNKNNIVNFSLAPDCICEIKCEIEEIERILAEEKQRVYEKITDFFSTSIPSQEVLNRYISLLCILNNSTGELDCCIAKVLGSLEKCEEGECNE